MDKNIIIKEVYYNNKQVVITFTAEWCNPCKKIKPSIVSFLEKRSYKLISKEEITKDFYKSLSTDHKFVPAFYLGDDYIQTSNISEFVEFYNLRIAGEIITEPFTIVEDF